MSFDARGLAFAICLALAVTTEATAGFGCILVALTLGVWLYPIPTLLPVVVPASLMLTATIVTRHRAHVEWRLLLRRVLPLMGIGLVGGLALAERASAESLRRVFGAFVVVVSVRELHALWRPAAAGRRPLAPAAGVAGLLGAGVIHGVFAAGGPLLVYVLGRSRLDKARFRSTLATVWLTLNTALTGLFVARGRLGSEQLPWLLALAPVVAIGVVAGEIAHRRLDEQRFRQGVFALLGAAGLALLW